MKSTGIVRKVDELGRVVLPIELRRNMGIEIKDSLEIFVEEDVYKRQSPSRYLPHFYKGVLSISCPFSSFFPQKKFFPS